MDDNDWSRLVDELRMGACTPFIGAGACYPQLPLSAELSKTWATGCHYPFNDPWNLPRVMQYDAIRMRDHITVKRRVADDFNSKGCPDFDRSDEPHALLAEFPLPVYLTTNYDNFMVSALQRTNKKRPLAIICPWYENAPTDSRYTISPSFTPSADEPIVYHLHGSCEDPASLVLTEEDYLEFLVNLAKDKGADDQRLIPTVILPSFTRLPLLFIGYNLQDWTFRVIFDGLRRTVTRVQKRRHVSVQLLPPINKNPGARKRAEDYLTAYLDKYDVSIYWGTAQEFSAELRMRLSSSA